MPVFTDHLLPLKKSGRCGAVSGKNFNGYRIHGAKEAVLTTRSHKSANAPRPPKYEFENIDIATPTY